MIGTLAFRHLWIKKRRSALLLLGFALGVGVMIVLLSVGEAMLEQSRDTALVGGGEVTVLPVGIDVEAMRTGGVSGMFFGIDHARFLTRQLLGGPRYGPLVLAVAPEIEGKTLYLTHGATTLAVRAGGEIPSRATAVGSPLDLLEGDWRDSPVDSAWIAPTPGQLYDELDRFHVPPHPNSSWAEWDYFNVTVSPDEWWYVTLLVGGEVRRGRWGGQVLITRRGRDGHYDRFLGQVPAEQITLDTSRADLTLGGNALRQVEGAYRLTASAVGVAGKAQVNLEIHPARNQYFPPVELREEALLSGYVVPALAANATGMLCVSGECRRIAGAPAYHDHNWGVWRGVTWEWGAARGERFSLLYGGVYSPDVEASGTPFFLALVDSLGLKQILRFSSIRYHGARSAAHGRGVEAPESFDIVGGRDRDTVSLTARVADVLASEPRESGPGRRFLQMHGPFRLTGRVAGMGVADSGSGFFETYIR